MTAAMLDEAPLSLFVCDPEDDEFSGVSADSDNEWEALRDGWSYLNCPSYSYLFWCDLLFQDFALFRFSSLIKVKNACLHFVF